MTISKIILGMLMIGTFYLMAFSPDITILKKDGAAPGYTGSPGDSLKNCTACHGGDAIKVEGWVQSNIPSSGYIPGERYTITPINYESGATRFGFEVSPQDLKGNLLGQMIITDTLRTKFVGGEKYVTYTANGIDGQDSVAWNFDWIAPATGTGDVTFYGGFNSNYDNHKDNDKTYLSTLTVKEKISSSVSDLSEIISEFKLFPNPTSDFVSVNLDLKEKSRVTIDISDLSCKQVTSLVDEDLSGNFSKKFSTSQLTNGTYLVRFKIGNQSTFKKLTIAR